MAEVDSMAGKMPTPLFNLDRALVRGVSFQLAIS